MNRRAFQIAVVGGYDADKQTLQEAEKIGELLANSGAVTISGGRIGVSEAVCRGAKTAGGVTVGIIPGSDSSSASQDCDIVIPSGMGEMRNVLIIRSADAVIALPGKFGTLSEVAFALTLDKPVVSLGSWEVSDKIVKVDSPEQAVETALKLSESHRTS